MVLIFSLSKILRSLLWFHFSLTVVCPCTQGIGLLFDVYCIRFDRRKIIEICLNDKWFEPWNQQFKLCDGIWIILKKTKTLDYHLRILIIRCIFHNHVNFIFRDTFAFELFKQRQSIPILHHNRSCKLHSLFYSFPKRSQKNHINTKNPKIIYFFIACFD